MSEPSPTPAQPRAERALLCSLAAIAAVACGTDIAIAIARAAHALRVSETMFNILTTWALGLMFLGICAYFIRDDDRHHVRLLARLDVGNEALDHVLDEEGPLRRDWRLRPATRTVTTAASAACWFVAALYTTQMAIGVNRTIPTTQMMVLRLFLTCANLFTLITLATVAPSRRAAALELVYEAHSIQRGKRTLLADAAATADTTGEMPRLDHGDCTVTTVDFEGRKTLGRHSG